HVIFSWELSDEMTGRLQLCIAAIGARRQPFGTRRGERRERKRMKNAAKAERHNARFSGRGGGLASHSPSFRACALRRIPERGGGELCKAQKISLADFHAIVAQNAVGG